VDANKFQLFSALTSDSQVVDACMASSEAEVIWSEVSTGGRLRGMASKQGDADSILYPDDTSRTRRPDA